LLRTPGEVPDDSLHLWIGQARKRGHSTLALANGIGDLLIAKDSFDSSQRGNCRRSAGAVGLCHWHSRTTRRS
jgi:hypothetical protein